VPELLKALSARYPVYLVSGRRVSDLEALLGPLGIPVFGVHGAEEGVLGGPVRARLRKAEQEALKAFRERIPEVPGLRLEDKGSALALHYRGAPDEEAVLRALKPLLESLPEGIEALFGKKVVEIKPKEATKGTVARELAARHPGRTPVAIGDDATDEQMFLALPQGIAIKVGPGESAARYRLSGPAEVVQYLKQYIEGDEDEHPEAD